MSPSTGFHLATLTLMFELDLSSFCLSPSGYFEVDNLKTFPQGVLEILFTKMERRMYRQPETIIPPGTAFTVRMIISDQMGCKY